MVEMTGLGPFQQEISVLSLKDQEKLENIEHFFTFLASTTHKPYRLSSTLQVEAGWINPCDPKFIKMLKLPRPIEYFYTGEAITSISHRVYSTTSLRYLVMACSGYLHPHEIPRNVSIQLPDPTNVDLVLQEPKESNIGKMIVI